jgi:hypothetical protein
MSPKNWTLENGHERCEATFRLETPMPKSPKAGDHFAMNTVSIEQLGANHHENIEP